MARLVRISTPRFTAGLIVDDYTKLVIEAAPILKHLKGWKLRDVRDHCEKKSWEIRTSHTPQVYSKRSSAADPPPDAVLVDRTTPFGNPFKVGGADRNYEAVYKYKKWIWKKKQLPLRRKIREELRGKDLVCWCKPLPCHADVILEIANGHKSR